MSDKIVNRLVALFVFVASIVVYMKTLSTTVVFWDVGEFCAAAFLMQVPHPPGSPFFLYVAKVVSMVPFLPDIASRMHAISAFASAFGAMFLYLTTVKVITLLKGEVSSLLDKIAVYGSSAIGALSLAYSMTYWFNATEAEVYGSSMFFVTFIMWLIFRWWENAEEPHNEKYILFIAYLIGLSTGVHLLAVLAVFPVMMLMYFRLYEVNQRTLIVFGVVTVCTFGAIYPGIVQYLPSMLDGDFMGIKTEIMKVIPFAVIIFAAIVAWKTYKSEHKLIHIASLSFVLIVIGYMTYAGVLIRSNARPPMNENSPDNLAKLVSYLSREQYGDTPLLKGESWDNGLQDYKEKMFPRRYSRESMHEPTRTNYTSDMDFFWRYQTDHMFIRYVLWNFVGQEGDWQDAGVGWKSTYGIPLWLGLFGLLYHFWKDRRMSLVFLVMFVIMGFVLAWYQNQQEPQPRERDYFYVGAYYVFAIWISIGIFGLITLLRDVIKSESTMVVASVILLSFTAFASPVAMLRTNYHDLDRSQNYIAWDYSYNILQSCEPDAILFTNGDNDTFPLWYLQDVEGVRRDIRIVNLSLVNTSWYILQLKNEMPHGAKKVPISLNDAAIEHIQPQAWKPRQVNLPVPKEALDKFLTSDRPQTPTWILDSSVVKDARITFTVNGVPYNNDMRFLRVQDLMIWDIIRANNWDRPVYFAATCSPDSKLGLDEYLWMQGLSMKLKPFKIPSTEGGADEARMESNLLADSSLKPSTSFQSGFRFRNLNNPNVYYDENTQRMVMNYRASFLRLFDYAYRVENNREKAKQVLQTMEERMPISVVPNLDWRYTAHFMNLFRQMGLTQNFETYANIAESKCWELVNKGSVDQQDFNPYQILQDIYETRKDYPKALDVVQRWRAQFEQYLDDPQYANNQSLKQQIQYLDNSIAMYQQNIKNGTAPKDTTKLP